jgi:hypothetical protein
MMNGPEKSDSVIVAGKPTNKVERSAAICIVDRTGKVARPIDKSQAKRWPRR